MEPCSYAKFWRCALQVNPARYSAQYRGQGHSLDDDAYNQAILKKCLDLNIKVIGIADHGSVDSVERMCALLQANDIVVFPGFEIASTEKIHMVCLFPEDTSKDQLNRYLGRLDLTDVTNGVRPSSLGCLELAKRICELGGFWYAAHVTGNNGLLRLNKDGGGLTHVWQDHQKVRVAQIPGPVTDLPSNYLAIVENRDPNYKRVRRIALINAKDVAKPDDLAQPGATCWVKMTRPSFEAFRVAFLDPESRIRLQLDSEPHSALVSVRITGGYLDGLDAQLSEHLNAVIGGRGTGKSTLLECLRYVLELSPKGKQAQKIHQDIIKENLGKSAGSIELVLRSNAQHGKTFTVTRRYAEPPIVRDERGVVSKLQPRDLLPNLDFYGQNEIYELAQDTTSRVKLLDRFLPINIEAGHRRDQLRRRLDDNLQKLTKALADLDELDEQVARLPKLSEQLAGYQDLGIEAKLAKMPLFAREKQLVERVQQEVTRLNSSVSALQEGLPDLAFLGDKVLDGLPNAGALTWMRGTLGGLRSAVEKHVAELTQLVEQGEKTLKTQVQAWQTALNSGERELEQAVANLPNMAGKGGREVAAAYKQLTQEIERVRPLAAKRDTLAQLCESLRQERESLVAELSDLRSNRAAELARAVADLNKRLAGKLKIHLDVEGDRAPLKAFLAACKLDGIGEKRLAWLDTRGDVTPRSLARAIRDGSSRLASEFELTPMVAEALAKLPRNKLFELEVLELGDLLDVQLNVAHDGSERYRSLEHLSTGQQCTAILHLLLLQNSDPLIVDQPEDNLDNAFIAERIVSELREAKTRRQFLFSTHNANIPVFGDAEWIGVLSASENKGVLGPEQQGSIDVPHIREQAAEILEGGRAAFIQRKEMYEF